MLILQAKLMATPNRQTLNPHTWYGFFIVHLQVRIRFQRTDGDLRVRVTRLPLNVVVTFRRTPDVHRVGQ